MPDYSERVDELISRIYGDESEPDGQEETGLLILAIMDQSGQYSADEISKAADLLEVEDLEYQSALKKPLSDLTKDLWGGKKEVTT